MTFIKTKKLKVRSNYWAFISCWTFFLIGCKTDSGQNRTATESLSINRDFFPVKSAIKYAKNFTVSYHNNYKVVRTSATLGDWGAESTDLQDVQDIMVLVQNGTPVPSLSGELSGATVIEIQSNPKIAVNYAGLEIWMDMLGLSNNLVAIGGTKTYDDTLRSRLEQGKLGEVGYSWAAPPDMEVLLERKPELFFMVISRIGFNEHLGKIRQLGISSIPVFDWGERDYMARAEWIKFCALFFNLEKEANQIFEEIEQRVTELKQLAESSRVKPTCLWGHFVNSGFWMANANNAEARLLKDAGVINPVEDFTLPFNPTGEPFTNEEWLEAGNQADHWIISGGTMGLQLPSKKYLESFKAWQNNNLYHHYARSKPEHDAYDWYNLSAIRPDYVLADLIALFHPNLLPDHEFVFFGDLQKQDVL